jgi:predicted acyl esterase
VVAQDTPGRFASDGEWLPWKSEREDGYDTVEWAASLPGSNGKVGISVAVSSAALSGVPPSRGRRTWSPSRRPRPGRTIVVKAGHRLRVQVTSSNFPRWDRNLNTGQDVTEGTTARVAQQRIHHDRDRPSRITLPIVPAEPEAD